MSAGLGLLFGLLIFALWWFTGWTRLCLVFDALFLGFLVGATLMFTPFGKCMGSVTKGHPPKVVAGT